MRYRTLREREERMKETIQTAILAVKYSAIALMVLWAVSNF